MDKITDLQKIVTDPVLLKHLAEQSVDKDYVEFFQDYAPRSLGKEHSPYAKFYRDLVSSKRFMVVSGLPMVDADGVKIEAGWRVAGVNYFAEKNNLFRAKVQGTDVEIVIRNDQPDGRKANDRLSYKPQLFLEKIPWEQKLLSLLTFGLWKPTLGDYTEQVCGDSTLLPVDPLNPNYLGNTLEWDYGICKRRLRIIEGSILGSWVFASKPDGIVWVKYNQTGDFKLKLGQFEIGDDEEVVTPKDLDELAKFQGGYPVTVSDSATYYPDAHPESTSVDGLVGADGLNLNWPSIRAYGGNYAVDSGTDYFATAVYGEATTNYFGHLYRSIFLFNTSGLPDDATISAATLSLRYTGKEALYQKFDLAIYSSAPASNKALAAGDFDSIGPLGAEVALSATVLYDNYVSGYNAFAFNASGIASIKKTAADPISKYGTRDPTYDVGGAAPTWAASTFLGWLGCYYSEGGTGCKPKLVVTYTVPSSRGWWSK